MYIEGANKWSESKETPEATETITVYEAENGYVIYFEKYLKDDKIEDYSKRRTCVLKISKTNPLEGKEKVSDKFNFKGIMSGVEDGKINVD